MIYQETNSLVDRVMKFKISGSTIVLFQKALREVIKITKIIVYTDKLNQRSVDAAHAFIQRQDNGTAAELLDAIGSMNLGDKVKEASRLIELLQVIIKFYSQIETIAEDQDYFKSRVKMLKNAYRPGRS